MNYEEIKKEFIKLKKEELNYINEISIISNNKKLSEYEKIEIYRNLKKYENQLNDKLKQLHKELLKVKKITTANLEDIIIEFELDKDFLSLLEPENSEYKQRILKYYLGIDIKDYKYKLTIYSLLHYRYEAINLDLILKDQKLLEQPIYIFSHCYDESDEICGFFLGEYEDLLYGVYDVFATIAHSYHNKEMKIPKKKMEEFEKENTIIHSTHYVLPSEVKQIFKEELLSKENKTINDCIIKTKKKIKKLTYLRGPEYKEKVLLDRINKLYKGIKGTYIKKETLYNGNFLNLIKETYKLPNNKLIEKEKVVKNSGKDSVIVVAITSDNDFIITFQNRIKDQIIAEFPSGYIEHNEDPLEAAKRELKEETGYTTNNLFIAEQVYTSPGIDNSITYIVIANECKKTDDIETSSNEFINYGLFTEIELKYLIYSNIMSGSMNKLAYYSLMNSVDEHGITDKNGKRKIYIKERQKKNPLK